MSRNRFLIEMYLKEPGITDELLFLEFLQAAKGPHVFRPDVLQVYLASRFRRCVHAAPVQISPGRAPSLQLVAQEEDPLRRRVGGHREIEAHRRGIGEYRGGQYGRERRRGDNRFRIQTKLWSIFRDELWIISILNWFAREDHLREKERESFSIYIAEEDHEYLDKDYEEHEADDEVEEESDPTPHAHRSQRANKTEAMLKQRWRSEQQPDPRRIRGQQRVTLVDNPSPR